MNALIWHLPLLIFTGFTAMIMIYYSIALQRLSPGKIEKLFKIKGREEPFHGIPVPFLITSIRIAAILMELLFLFGLLLYMLQKEFSPIIAATTVLIGFLFEVVSRLFLPSSFPLSQRDRWKPVETGVFLVCGYIFFPVAYSVIATSRRLENLFFPTSDDQRITKAEETIKSIINVGEEEGIFKEDDGELLQSIVEFSETIVREVMTPRIDLQCIELSESVHALVQRIIDSGYSKIPAYRERIDNIEGILYAKDILRYWNQNPDTFKLEEIIRPAYFVPETKKVQLLLREFQRDKMHMAIVVDEYGGVAGLVTIEDLLEEIVGEIHDEYDTERELILTIDDDQWMVDAKIDLDELTEITTLEFPEDNYETLGGFLFDQFGHIPAAGENLQYENFKFEIKEADERKITKVVIHRLPPAESYPDANGIQVQS